MSMKIIINNQEKIYIIEKSKFISIVKRIDTKEEIDKYLLEIKKQYFDATHICYAYILNNEKRYNDDNEPTGTAGKPILEILEKNQLNYVLLVVVRYFGGIKLGSNGLIRAYTNSSKIVLENNTKEQEQAYLIEIETSYDNIENLNYLLKDSNIINKNFQEKVKIQAIVKKEILDNLTNISFQIIKDIII